MFFEMNLSCIRLLFTNPNIKQTEREENFLLNLFYGGYSMNLFQNVKYGVSCREAAERYGVSVNRQGKALCPFHNDRHPSLYVADNHYFCFACGAHGDVIDFAADFFDLPLYEAAQRLAADFGIDTDRPPTKKILEKRRQQTEAQQLTENERLCCCLRSATLSRLFGRTANWSC